MENSIADKSPDKEQALFEKRQADIDSLTRMAKIATTVYVVIVSVYVFLRKGYVFAFFALEPSQFGDFLAGAAAPLALGWIVFGFHLQREQLAMQMHELRMQLIEFRETKEATQAQVTQLALQAKVLTAQFEAQENRAFRETSPFLGLYWKRELGARVGLNLTNIGAPARDLRVHFMSPEGLSDKDDLEFDYFGKEDSWIIFPKMPTSPEVLKVTFICTSAANGRRYLFGFRIEDRKRIDRFAPEVLDANDAYDGSKL